MTQEEKQLLLKDITARLLYGVICQYTLINGEKIEEVFKGKHFDYSVECKPFLRPMSSMTDEEKEHLQSLHNIISDENYGDGYSPAAWDAISEFNDYCHEHHLDNRGLIGKGLALEAPEHMYD
jgi:hypothetical protein